MKSLAVVLMLLCCGFAQNVQWKREVTTDKLRNESYTLLTLEDQPIALTCSNGKFLRGLLMTKGIVGGFNSTPVSFRRTDSDHIFSTGLEASENFQTLYFSKREFQAITWGIRGDYGRNRKEHNYAKHVIASVRMTADSDEVIELDLPDPATIEDVCGKMD